MKADALHRSLTVRPSSTFHSAAFMRQIPLHRLQSAPHSRRWKVPLTAVRKAPT